MVNRIVLTASLALLWAPAMGRGDEWPQFRGPSGNGVSDEKQLPTEWGPDKNVKWKVAIPGTGWSQPVVWGDKVFLTTAVTDNQKKPRAGGGMGGFGGGGGGFPGGRPGGFGGPPQPGRVLAPALQDSLRLTAAQKKQVDDLQKEADGKLEQILTEAQQKQLKEMRDNAGRGGFGGPGGFGGGKPPDAVYRWEVYCLDRDSGKVLWKRTAREGKPTIPTQESNTYATETPVTDGERIYAYFGMHGVYCYDFGGKLLWKKDLGTFPMRMGFGTASSPAYEGGRLFVQVDNEENSFLVALDGKTGDELWRAARGERTNWGSPVTWKNKKRTELVCPGTQRVISYDPATGKVLWELALGGGQCSASPAGDDERLYVGTSGFGGGPGGPGGGPEGPGGRGGFGGGGWLFAVVAGASGDVTPKPGETASAGVAWSRAKAGPGMASPLSYRGYVYVMEQNGGMVNCYDAATGKPAYTKERIPRARAFWASPWAGDGKIFCLDDDGVTHVLAAGPEFKVLGKNKLDDQFWATPAPAGGSLILRGIDSVFCVKP